MPSLFRISALQKSIQADIRVSIALSAIILFFIGTGFLTYKNTQVLRDDMALVAQTHSMILQLGETISSVKDVETEQRGYLLTGNEALLEPYANALAQTHEQLTRLEQLMENRPGSKEQLEQIKQHITAKLNEMAATIELYKAQGPEAALALVNTGRGQNEMTSLRTAIESVQQQEQDIRRAYIAEMDRAYRFALLSTIISTTIGVLLAGAVAWLVRRTVTERRRQQWLEAGHAGLNQTMLGEQSAEELGNKILHFLAEYSDAQAGAFYMLEDGVYRRMATYGVASSSDTPHQVKPGDGLLGQAVRSRHAHIINDIPDNYLTISSALGKSKPRRLVILPAVNEGTANAIIELGFIHPLNELLLELLNRASNAIAIAVRSANYRSSLQNLLHETQRQAEELQSQSEELRVSNEELEEQSRALKESQFRLEQQQAELEQTNTQLEEQTRLLETQRDDLAEARNSVLLKARELEQASQYKSNFLANMSHELRTPLNSSLILAKLLADNPAGNLTAEQVKFAQTIQNSGNDLLTLINDILDLSKIEAGHMEIRAEPVRVETLTDGLLRLFKPIADEKGLELQVRVEPGTASMLDTDRQRLEQILRNLLSNAIKFTEKGKVELVVAPAENGQISFTVSDTGIGIAEENRKSVFEAFRQADGTISRKYGGTGLGLSISRQLAWLMGGQITLSSQVGKGSTFTLVIPVIFKPVLATASAPASTPAPARSCEKVTSSDKGEAMPPLPRGRVEDDRHKLTKGGRLILIIEDDETFARILCDMAHEMGFECVIASTAEDALAAVRHYPPSAVLLDVMLPDNTGLSVLDRLKQDMRTRHIPVHVISGGDYAQTALSLGASGYLLKPVKRDELAETLRQVETLLSQNLRRVLIVEDDPVQQDSVARLLASAHIETVGVGTAADCLQKLREASFDCVVLDLSLPDASGYSLLETLSQEYPYSFPPVIVYTGRDLSADEEQRLRQYSKSIIIKGAKSPERLLDEVTLFLHQVVSELPAEQQRMLEQARNRDAVLENRRILVVEDDVANIYAITSILEPRGVKVQIARNGREALTALEKSRDEGRQIDLVLMDVMMPEVDGITATMEIRKNKEWKKLPIIMLTAKAMKNDQERCLEAGANDYMAKPLDVDKLLSLVRVWMPR